MKKILTLAISDFKLIFRDPSLRIFLAFPLLLFGVFIWLIPNMVAKYAFLEPYLSVFLMVGVIKNTQMFSFISSMVLIDEKETGVSAAYGIVPLSKFQIITSRLLISFLITVTLNIILIKVQVFYAIIWLDNTILSILTAMTAPVYVLAMNCLVKNRMEGMIYVKALNMVVLVPLAAYFVPSTFKYFFGILPTFWVFESVENITHGLNILIPALIGFMFFTTLIVGLSQLFIKGTLFRYAYSCSTLF